MNNYRKIKRCISNNTSNWADLPKELLEKIGKHLKSRIDVFRYRAVCSSWRSSISLSSHSISNFHPFMSRVTICRLEDTDRSTSCLVKLVETTLGHFEILNPLTIPKSDLILGKILNLLDSRLFELAEGLHFDSTVTELDVKKAVLFRDCGILAIYDHVKLGFRFFGDKFWTPLGNYPKILYEDIIVCQGEYFVLDIYGNIYWINKFMNIVKYLPRLNSSGQQKNLIESEGQLYVVDSYFRSRSIVDENGNVIDSRYSKVDMKVYKLDEKWGTWVQVTSLKDRIFVLGKDVCFSVSVTDFPGCEGNCIYFIDSVCLEENMPGYRFYDEETECNFADLCRPYPQSMRGAAARSPSLMRYHDEKMGYYVPRVFEMGDRSMKDIEGSPSLKQLFSPPKNCFCSTLSFP